MRMGPVDGIFVPMPGDHSNATTTTTTSSSSSSYSKKRIDASKRMKTVVMMEQEDPDSVVMFIPDNHIVMQNSSVPIMCSSNSTEASPSSSSSAFIDASFSSSSSSLPFHSIMGITGLSSKVTSAPPQPLREELFDLHVSITDNLHLIHPKVQATQKEIKYIHALHRCSIFSLSLPVSLSLNVYLTDPHIHTGGSRSLLCLNASSRSSWMSCKGYTSTTSTGNHLQGTFFFPMSLYFHSTHIV